MRTPSATRRGIAGAGGNPMAKALIRFPGRLEELTTTEMKHSIREANLGKDDTRIAELYLLERKPQIDVADCCEIDRKTIHRHMPFICEKVEFTASKLGFLQKGT